MSWDTDHLASQAGSPRPEGRTGEKQRSPHMRLTVIGTGYLGLTHAVCLADLGHEVMALDADADKVARASKGEVPFFEPGLEPLLRKNLDSGRLRFTTSFAEAAESGDVHFLCVGTPQAASGAADLRYVHSAADALAAHLCRPSLVVGKSTVPVGTARSLAARIRRRAPAGHSASRGGVSTNRTASRQRIGHPRPCPC